MNKILIVDGNSILNRAFYGVKGLTTKDGMPTNAIFGMVNILQKHLSSIQPTHAAIAFDLKAPTFRHQMYEGYKANRTGMPDDLAVQLPYAKECVSYLGFHVVECVGYEADDILGTLSDHLSDADSQVYILTGDRDSLQLITDHVTVLLATNKDTIPFDRARFFEEYGVESSVFVDVKALMGDSSDNIPGVAGIGSKTALKLIAEFGSLDQVYQGYESAKLGASVKQKLADGKDNAYLSQKLARISLAAPIDADIKHYEYDGIKKPELRNLFEKLAFSGLIRKFGLDVADTPAIENTVKTVTEELAKPIPMQTVEVADLSQYLINKEVALSLHEQKLQIYDGNQILTLQIDDHNCNDVSAALRECKYITHDCKSLYHAMESMGMPHADCYFDTMLAAYVLNASRNSFALREVYLEYTGKTFMEETPASLAIFELYLILQRQIEETGVKHLMFDIEMPLAYVLADMERIGFRIDTEGVAVYGEQLSEVANSLSERIYALAGMEFNIQSPKQLGEVLFEHLGLPVAKKTKTGYSTNAEVLGKLIGKHPIIEDILDYRQVTKLKSTYADGLLRVADGEGRIHTVFNQTGTATGRLSSSEPNLQNIPVKTELGREFRKFFIPQGNDYVIVDADYSQIELRLLAAISGDENMIEAFRSGADIHTSTAVKVFGISEEDVTTELRKRAKAVNFGIVYGIGEYSLSEDLGISIAQAKKYIDSYMNGFPAIRAYLEGIKEKARKDGFVSTLYGRRRYIPELSSSNKNLQHFGERVAMNSPIQGTAADIIKVAMIRVHRRLKESGLDAKLILQVHDELLLEAHRDCAEQALSLLKEEMELAITLLVPLDVDAHVGSNWFEAK